MFCKCRRVKDNQVIGIFLHLRKELECIFGKSLVAVIAREVQIHIVVGELDCFRRAVNGVYQIGIATHSIE